MPNRKTPTAILSARGGLSQPSRAAAREGEPEPLGEVPRTPPAYFDGMQRECWMELRRLIYNECSGEADGPALELAAILFAKIRSAPYSVDSSTIARFQGFLASFGMTPADRTKIKTPTKPEKPKAGFAQVVAVKRA